MAHITLNGEKYRLDESGEGQHYVLSHQPLRPPNAQLVQGESGQFQLRPDLLQWSWTDWSGGENQIKLDPSDSSRAFLLQNVSPFRRRGELTIGYDDQLAQDSSGVADFTVPGTLVKAYGSLFMVGSAVDDIFEWDGTKFGAAEDITTATAASDPNSSVGDQEYLFVHETGTTKIHRRTIGGTWSNHNDQCGLTGEIIMVELGANIYIWEPLSGKVYEISKATANTADAETEIYNVPISSVIDTDQFLMVAGDNRVYLAVSINGETSIHEIIPSGAAGTGYGTEFSKIPGVTAEAIFYAGGTLFMVGFDTQPDGTPGPDRQVFYIDPESTYGTLGTLRGHTVTNGPSASYPVPASGRLAFSAIALPGTSEFTSDTSARIGLFEIDQVSGGIAQVGNANADVSGLQQATSLVYFEGLYFASLASKCQYWAPNTTPATKSGIAISPANDFNLAGLKILESIHVICDPLPASSVISVGWQADGGAWFEGALVTATGAVGASIQISHSTGETKTFRSLKLRVDVDSSANGAPIVKSVEVFARVNTKLRVWDLILDLADDREWGYNGAKLRANLLTIGENEHITLIDHYATHDHTDGGETVSVILDSISFNTTQEGEGQAFIRLIEAMTADSVWSFEE